MDQAEFDKFADEYRSLQAANIRASGETPEFFAEYKVRDVARIVMDRGLNDDLCVLDFGAGVGTSVPYFRRILPSASLTCLDVSKKSLEIGRQRFAKEARFEWFDGRLIPFLDGRFDLTFAACVFHHIPADRHVPLLVEIKRVLRPGGVLVVFEHNPLNPLTVRAVNTCPFDENAVLINAGRLKSSAIDAGFVDLRCAYRVFFPGFLRGLRFIERRLSSLPLGAQYYVTASKPA